MLCYHAVVFHHLSIFLFNCNFVISNLLSKNHSEASWEYQKVKGEPASGRIQVLGFGMASNGTLFQHTQVKDNELIR